VEYQIRVKYNEIRLPKSMKLQSNLKLIMITIIYCKTNFNCAILSWASLPIRHTSHCRPLPRDHYIWFLTYLTNFSLCPSITMVSHLSSNLALWRFVGLHWETKVVGLRHDMGFLWGSYFKIITLYKKYKVC
jgi:hypothetical protein